LLGGWLQLHQPATTAGETVMIELLNIDSRPVSQPTRPIPAHPVPPVIRKTSQHPPVTPQPAQSVPEPSVVRSTTPAATPIATVAQAAPTALSAAIEPVSHMPAAAQPAIEPQQIKAAKATAIDKAKMRLLLRDHLESFKFYPASARRRNIEGDVDVGFTLTHNGTADQVTVLHGSGHAVLDHAALETVHRAQPFPAEDGQYQFRLRFKRL